MLLALFSGVIEPMVIRQNHHNVKRDKGVPAIPLPFHKGVQRPTQVKNNFSEHHGNFVNLIMILPRKNVKA